MGSHLVSESKVWRLFQWGLYLLSGLLVAQVLWGIVSESWAHEDYIGAGLVLGLAFTSVVVTYLHRKRPRDRFQFYHPWKIADRTTGRVLWLIAGFDALMALAMFGVFMAPLSLAYGSGTAFFAAIVGLTILATLPNGYRYMRRLYDSVQVEEFKANRLSVLKYKGYSEGRFGEMLLAGIPTSVVVFVVLLFVFVLVL